MRKRAFLLAMLVGCLPVHGNHINWGTDGLRLHGPDGVTPLSGHRQRDETTTGFVQLLWLGPNGVYDGLNRAGNGTLGDDAVIAQSWIGDGNPTFMPGAPGRFDAGDNPTAAPYTSATDSFAIRVFDTAVADADWNAGNIPATGHHACATFSSPAKLADFYDLWIRTPMTVDVPVNEAPTVLRLTLTLVAAEPPALVLGMAEGASDGFDPDVDLPTAAPEVGGHARLVSPDFANDYQKDYRAIADEADYFLVVEAGTGQDVVVSWNAPRLPAGKSLGLWEVAVDIDAATGAVRLVPVDGTALDMNHVASLTVAASATRTFVIRFASESWTLLVLAPDGNGVTAPAAGFHAYGTDENAAIAAHAASGWRLDHWLLDGAHAGAANPITMPAGAAGQAKTLKPVFTRITYTLFYHAGANGTLVGGSPQTQRVAFEANGVPIHALPDEGYAFALWSDGAATNPRSDLAVARDIAVTAQFHAIDRAWHALRLDAGWNQISLPLTPLDRNVDAVLGGGSLHRQPFFGAVWRWQPDTALPGGGHHVPVQQFEALIGHQVFGIEPMVIMVEGEAVANQLELVPGWNFRGVAATCANPVGIAGHLGTLRGGAWFRNNAARRYRLVPTSGGQLEPGNAYWFYATDTATIELGP